MDSHEILIGIPTLNGPERLTRCLEAIMRHTPLEAYRAKVLVSDDFSYERRLEENKKICANYGVDILQAPARIGVAQQWNRLTLHTPSPIVILMNDDVEVVGDWLEALVFSLRENPHAGMIGLKAYQGVTSGNFTPPPVHSYNEAVFERGVGMISTTGFLFGFRRELYDYVGGFDPNFFAFYEEIDFGVRLFGAGFPSYMLSYPIVLHQGGATTSDLRNIDAQKIMRESREKFKLKHGSIQALRKAMIDPIPGYPKPVQWNTMLKTWVD